MNTGEKALAEALRHIMALNQTIERLESKLGTIQAILNNVGGSVADELQKANDEIACLRLRNDMLSHALDNSEKFLHGRQ